MKKWEQPLKKWEPYWDLKSIPEDVWMSERQRRVGLKRINPGRAKVMRPCPKCGVEYSAREMRYHPAQCPMKFAVA